MGVLVTEVVQEPRLRGLDRIGGVDTVHVSPNHQLIRVHYVSDDGPGKIGTVAPQSSDASIRGSPDESRNHRYDAIAQQGQQNFSATLPGLLQMRLGILKCIASQD